MSLTRLSVLAVTALAFFPLSSCTLDDDDVGILEPRFAKGGKPGPPTDEVKTELLEFYVWENEAGESVVHVKGTGEVPFVNLNAVQDYRFNGIRDLLDEHYEYSTFSPPPVEVLAENRADDGSFSVDIPWDGARKIDSSTGEVLEYFTDFPTADADGSGADPYSFQIRFQDATGNYLGAFYPRGIVIDGNDTGSAESGYGGWTSYALFKGEPAGGEIFLSEVALDQASLSCSNSRSFERVDKEKITVWTSEVSGNMRIRTEVTAGSELPADPGLWLELHMVDVVAEGAVNEEDVSQWAFSEGAAVDRDGAEILMDGPYTARFTSNVERSGMWVSFVVDYIFPTWYPPGSGSFAYNAELNSNDGFATLFPVATGVGEQGALAFTDPQWVDCR